MKSLIEELYYWNLEAVKTSGKEVDKLSEKLWRCEDEIIPLLNEKEKALFDKYIDLNNKMCSGLGCEGFLNGFRIGATMMIEVLHGNDLV